MRNDSILDDRTRYSSWPLNPITLNSLEMEYRYLGTGCGLRVSSLCLGTATFGPHPAKPKQCTEEEARDIMDAYVEAGGNFIDTADWCGRTQTV